MTLDELRLIESLINMYVDDDNPKYKEAKFVIEREIKMKVNDPRIFAKDRTDGPR